MSKANTKAKQYRLPDYEYWWHVAQWAECGPPNYLTVIIPANAEKDVKRKLRKLQKRIDRAIQRDSINDLLRALGFEGVTEKLQVPKAYTQHEFTQQKLHCYQDMINSGIDPEYATHAMIFEESQTFLSPEAYKKHNQTEH